MLPVDNYAYLGTAVRYPLLIKAGSPVIATGRDVIYGSLIMLLTTPKGTRDMLPEYGSRINELRWEPNDQLLETLLRTYVVDAVTQWEKRISLVKLSIIINENMILIKLMYRILASNEVDSFVFPYSRKKTPY